MGFSSSSKTTTSNSTTKPVYENQILGAYDNVNGAFNDNRANTQAIQGMLGGLLPQAQANYANNPTLDAAKGYVTSTLNDPYSVNPNLQSIIDQTNADTVNSTASSMGSRGNFGGSAMAKLVAGQTAKNTSGLLYNDYNNWQNRQGQAAAMAPGLSSADATNLSSLLGLSNGAANLTTDQALKQSAAVSSLLGPYTTTNGKQTEKSSGSLGGFLGALLLSAAQSAGSFAGG